jgi:predicted NBD/HSP70 family sugar kinase
VTSPVVVGLDNGGTSNNATVLTLDGQFLVDGLAESPSRVEEGPEVAVPALVSAFHAVLVKAGIPEGRVRAVGLDTPGPASSEGTICEAGSTNFSHPSWQGFDVRGALEDALGIPVVYNNDANAAALYAHHVHFGFRAVETSSVSVIVGTGLGGGLVQNGRIIKGASGTAGELGHVPLPLDDILEIGQPTPTCNCGQLGDAESVASLTAIAKNLLPYWLTRFPGHPLGDLDLREAARRLRSYAEGRDPMAIAIFEQQAKAIGRLLTIAANFTDPDAYLIGGGIVEAQADFRQWLLGKIRQYTKLRPEQARIVVFALVPDLDMAGARGSALAALALVPGGTAFQPEE